MRLIREWRYDAGNIKESIRLACANFENKHGLTPNGLTCRADELPGIEKATEATNLRIEISSLLLPNMLRLWLDDGEE